MADTKVKTPTQGKPKDESPVEEIIEEITPEAYNYASLVLDPDYCDLTNHLGNLFTVNNFSKTKGIPALFYFEKMMTDEYLSEDFIECVEILADTPDYIANMPEPQKTIGSKKFDYNFSELPTTIEHAQNLLSALTYFRDIAGYKPEAKEEKARKVLSLGNLKKAKSAGTPTNR